MSENVIQTSFSAGELAPSLFARTDMAKYHSGAALMRNFFVDYRSGASTRTGTKFIIQAFRPDTIVRIIPFEFSTGVTYVLEFGEHYIRFISNGGIVLEPPFAITGASTTIPGTITAVGNNFNVGDWIFIQNIVGTVELNNRFFSVNSVSGSVVTLADVSGNLINASGYTPYINAGSAARVYVLPSPYAAIDLPLLKFIQSASVMTLTHPNYPPTNLSLITPTNWTLVPISFATSIQPPTGLSFVASAVGTANYSYVVTSVDASGQESAPSTALAVNNVVNLSTTAGTITLSWVAAPGATQYNIYKAELAIATPVVAGASYGFAGFCNGTSFQDSNIQPDFSTCPQILQNPFAGNNPICASYFDQRLFYGGSNLFPTTFWGSQPGFFNNFNISQPIQDDDAITGTIVSTQLNAIRNMLPMPGGLIVLTSKGAWQVNGGSGSITTVAITPSNATATPQAYNGASTVPPIVVNFDVLYVQDKGSIVRDLSYNIYANIYTGTDVSLLSNHLIFNHTISEWAYAEEPFKNIWAIRDDGILLNLTFLKEQEIFGWSHHDTLGLFRSVCSVSEGNTNAVYVVVQRFLHNRLIQMIERFADRNFVYGAEDAWNVDCGIQSTLPTPAGALFGGAPTGNNVQFQSTDPVFSGADVGKVLRMGGGVATITQVLSSMTVLANITQPITVTIPNDPGQTPVPAQQGTWSLSMPFTTFLGLDYLNGQLVSILADGGVVTPQVVVNNQITLPQPATKVTVGLKFQPQLQTMYLDVGEPTIQGKRKKIAALTVRVANTRGLKAGRTFNTLVPIKELNSTTFMGTAIPLVTADERIIMDPLWDVPGQICLQIDDPLPATILGVIPEITVGDSVK